jgi:hypothetical protein
MKIRADENDFRRWIGCVPRENDLVFLNARAKEISLPVPLLTVDEVKGRNFELWSLNNRSWYGYALKRATFCASMPKGAIESLDEKTLKHLATMQIQMDVRTVLPTAKLSKSVRSKVPNFSTHGWVTSHAWSLMAQLERLECFGVWYSHNDIRYYETIEFDDLPSSARAELKRTGFNARLNRFASESGANCFATAAACITARPGTAQPTKIADEWLHWSALEKTLMQSGYRPMKTRGASARDVAVFSEKGKVVHAAYALSSEIYFEKPGQDFYEPYRIAKFSNASREWPKTALTIYRPAK